MPFPIALEAQRTLVVLWPTRGPCRDPRFWTGQGMTLENMKADANKMMTNAQKQLPKITVPKIKP
jgi:hypothetical protein